MKWLDLVPPPRKRPAPTGPFDDSPIAWDVFVSYRSSNRVWALALHDQLVLARFRPFLDQFALRPGLALGDSLDVNLTKSASGVLVLSKDVATSSWVKSELTRMRTLRDERAGSPFPFYYVIAKIEPCDLPFEDNESLYADFSSGYEDGPRGPELVRLVAGLLGQPISDAAVRATVELDEATGELIRKIRGAADLVRPARVFELATTEHPALHESPTVASVAAQALISAAKTREELENALTVVRAARKAFKRSVRLRQLEALALRRQGKNDDAQELLMELYQESHRDCETMGILGATWMKRYEQSHVRADLERSRAFYADAFATEPSNEYVGINAASKSALLGEIDLAKEIATQIGKLVSKFSDGSDFYKGLSLAEACVILGKYEDAARVYDTVRIRHPGRLGDLVTTREQVSALREPLSIPDEAYAKLMHALGS